MKVLHLTCWYPTDQRPNFGSFIKLQAEAIANNSQDLIEDCLLVAIVIQPSSQLYHTKTDASKIGRLNVKRIVISSKFWKLIQHTTPYLMAQATKLIGDFRPDIIHAHVSFPAGLIAARLAKRYRVNYIISEHWSGLSAKLEKETPIGPTIKTLRGARAILPVSNQLKDVIRQYVPTTQTIQVIPNIVSERFGYQTKDQQALSRYLVLMNMADRKRPDLVIDALSILKQRNPDILNGIEVLFVGSGPKRDNLITTVSQLNLPVKFIDAVSPSEVPALMQSVKALWHPTEVETFGLVVLEALACGTAVVCSAIENLNQLAAANPVGAMTVQAHQPMLWAEAIEQCILTNYDHETIARQVSRMTEQDFAERIVKLYQQFS